MSEDTIQTLLERLRALTATNNRQYVTPEHIDKETWECVALPSELNLHINEYRKNLIGTYIQRVQWANENCKGRYSRSLNAFWFEDSKDAFVFRLTWGEK
jgi:hypothetical protein